MRRELRLRRLDRKYRGETFAHVVAGRLDLRLLGQLFLLDIGVERPRHRLPQARQMRAAVALRDIVGEALHRFGVRIVPLHRDLDDHAVLFADGVKDPRVQHILAAVHVFDEALDATGKGEVLRLSVPLIDQLDLDAVVQKRELANAPSEYVVVKLDVRERRRRRHEVHLGSPALGQTDDGQRCDGDTVAKLHLMRLAVTPDLELQPLGQPVDDRDAYAVQPAGNLVRVLIEFTAGVELRHHDFSGGAFELVAFLHVGRNSAAVIDHRHGVVRVNDDLDVVAITGERFVDRVVQHLEHHVVQAGAVGRVSDVHAGALAHGLEAL